MLWHNFNKQQPVMRLTCYKLNEKIFWQLTLGSYFHQNEISEVSSLVWRIFEDTSEQDSVRLFVIYKVDKRPVTTELYCVLFICHHSPRKKRSGGSSSWSMLIECDLCLMYSFTNRNFDRRESVQISITAE